MQNAQVVSLAQARARRPQLPRDAVVAEVLDFQQANTSRGLSQRAFARETGVARATLQGHLARHKPAPPEDDLAALDAFFATPAGQNWLRRLFDVLVVVFTLVSTNGVRHLQLFLQLCGLDRWIASSRGSLAQRCQAVEQATVDFGALCTAQCGSRMKPRAISVCADETFHPRCCLVAIEPVSNFLLVETYAPGRDGETWAKTLSDALSPLPNVVVEQVVGDLAKGLRHAATDLLGAHAAPDLFHPQLEVSRGTACELRRYVDEATAAQAKAVQAQTEAEAAQRAYDAEPRGPGRSPDWTKRLAPVCTARTEADAAVATAVTHRNEMQAAMRSMSDAFHPFDLATGTPRTADQVRTSLDELFTKMVAIAHAARLSVRALRAIERAEGVVDVLVATIAWVHHSIEARLTHAAFDLELVAGVVRPLILALYVQRVAARTRDRDVRTTLRARAMLRLVKIQGVDSVWSRLPATTQRAVWALAQDCADLFQRATSCVEGRNGQLSLFHHRWHGLSARKLAALTAVHNYVLRRADGTTAAERFFGHKHGELLDWLRDTLPPPARPRGPRTDEPPLAQVA